MVTINLPGQTIGIIGKGKMTERLQVAAEERGYLTALFSNEKDADLLDFANKANLLVFESETVETDELEALQKYIEIPQLSEAISVTQDRLIEKVFLESLNINVVPYATITSVEDLKDAIGSIGFPCVLKPIRVEKNQPSNVMLYSEEDFGKTEPLLRTGTCILDAWVPYDQELAVSFVSGKNGQLEAFPVVETIYQKHHLQGIIAPAQIEPEMSQALVAIGKSITEAMALCGIITTEFLVTAVGTIYVKRVTTGVQKILDYTLDGTNINQYELFIRAICGLPIPPVKLIQPVVSYLVKPHAKDLMFNQIMVQGEWYLRTIDSGWLITAMNETWETMIASFQAG